MFKNLSIFRATVADVMGNTSDSLGALPFAPCGPTQPISMGWFPPRGHAHGALYEVVGGHGIARLRIERRILPGSVVRARVDEMAEAIQRDTGRKPGAKRRRELKDEALVDLMPQAFTRQADVLVWIAPTGLVGINSTSMAAVDAALSMLTKCLPGLVLAPVVTTESPAAGMRAWLQDAPPGFDIGGHAVLRAPDARGATVAYRKHGLLGHDVQLHLMEGKQVQALALNHQGRVEFVLTDSLQFKRVHVDAASMAPAEGDVDPFDADVVLNTGALLPMLQDLLEALGGETVVNHAA